MLVKVRLLGHAMTANYGTLVSGDILNCDKAFADHLVNDCKIAEFVVEKPVVEPEKKAKNVKQA